MPRPRDFTEQDALDAVTDVFVANGYNGTSIQMLTEATGLGKQSLYNTFGDKRALYLRSVDCSTSRYREMSQRMASAPTGREAIRLFFDVMATACASANPSENACIVSSGLLEDIGDGEIEDKLKSTWSSTHALLKREIARGQRDESIANAAPAGELADFLMSLTSGARVAARAMSGRQRVRKMIDKGLQILDVSA
jgi:TetR/AcrR family transcriptional regulator, transcriptional repressor for nem operon